MNWYGDDVFSQASREAFERMRERLRQQYAQQSYYTGTWTQTEPNEKQELILGLCYGAAYNKFPELELWDREKRIRLPQDVKDRVVTYLKACYRYYEEKYKDWKPRK